MTTKKKSSTGDHALIIFIRKPVLGKVKTRLANEVGKQKALEIYKLLQCHTEIVASECNVTRYLFYAGDIVDNDGWHSDHYNKLLQSEGGLGDRLIEAFKYVFSRHDKAVVIGSDCAQLRRAHLDHSFELLDKNDFVMGPTLDGGYYLLGLKKMESSFFVDMPWSTDKVASETRARAEKLDLSLGELEVLSDIDYMSDWEQYGAAFVLTSC